MRSPRPVGPRTLAERAAAARGMRAALARGDLSRVVLLVPDPHARFAAVELSGRFLAEEVLASGYGVCTYVFAWDPPREALPVAADSPLARYVDGYGDLRMRPDLATVTALPDGLTGIVCDVEWPGGEPARAAPRQALTEQLAALEATGFVPSAGLEHEVVFSDSGGPLTGHGVDYAVGGTERMRPLLRDLRAALDASGLGVESARAECHPGQYEIVLRHRDALAACDDALLQQLVVRSVAAEHGVRASYLAAPEAGQGNSCHVHLSLATTAGAPVSGEGTELSPVMASFLAGVLRDAAALTPVWAPTWNSYVRLRTAPFSPRELRWGVDDRTSSVRVAGRDGSLRLEFRFAGADAQPHLVLAALLAAGRAGIEEGLPLPPPGVVLGSLPGAPWEALAGLDRVAKLLGDEVAAQQEALLRAELDAGCETVTDWQRRRGALRA
ncbi:glutamine synthetase [Amycolatopsis thermophila]|uniref:Glutamine synthetase n=1 Tax=Amycolatopsis thermophila TaxID=206084 RepID=A0ABU0EYT6_9PSEU|nr:glutamine synthetase [Amycolatopsis thermophila]